MVNLKSIQGRSYTMLCYEEFMAHSANMNNTVDHIKRILIINSRLRPPSKSYLSEITEAHS